MPTPEIDLPDDDRQHISGVEPKPAAKALVGESMHEQTCRVGRRSLHDILASFPIRVHQDMGLGEFWKWNRQQERKCRTKVETRLSCHVGKLCASEHTVWKQHVTVHSQEQHKE